MKPEEIKLILITASIIALFLTWAIIIYIKRTKKEKLKNKLCIEISKPNPGQDWISVAILNKMGIKTIQSFESTVNFYFSKILQKWKPKDTVSFIHKLDNGIKKYDKRKYLFDLLEKLIEFNTEERLVDIAIEAIIAYNETAKDLVILALTYSHYDSDKFLVVFEEKLKTILMEDRCQNTRTTIKTDADQLMERIVILMSDLNEKQ